MKHFLFFAGLFFISTAVFSQSYFSNQQIINQSDVNIPVNMDAGDIDGDNDPDIVCISSADGTISWFENTDGQGSFSAKKIIVDTITAGEIVKLADADGDGDLDIFYTKRGHDSGLFWLENSNSAGKFTQSHFICYGAYAQSLLTTDIDMDGNLDLLFPSGEIYWFEYDTVTAQFEMRNTVADYFYNDQRFLKQIDADHDGDLDLIMESSSINGYGYIYLIPQDSSGGGIMGPSPYGTPEPIVSSPNYYNDAFAADMDGDGDADIVYCNPNDNTIAWLESTNAQPNFTTQHLITDSMPGVYKIFPADFDGDGDIDLAANSFSKGKLVWFENVNGTGSFILADTISAQEKGAEELIATDIDQDNHIDLFSIARMENRISWYSNDGNGNLSLQQNITESDYSGLMSIYPADLNGDNLKDVLVASKHDNKIGWYPNSSSGYGAYQLISDGIMGASGVSAADLDNDGDMDVVVTAKDVATVSWFENIDSQGTFGPENEVSQFVNEAYEVTPADLNGDGDMDLVVASEYSFLGWFENLGSGTFGNRFEITHQIPCVEKIITADIDNDGDMDILPVQSIMGLFWFENVDGIGNNFSKQEVAGSLGDITDVDVVDFDGDGDYDMIVSVTVLDGSISEYNKILFFENTGNGDFASKVVLTDDAKTPRTCKSIDYDVDGDYDVVWGSFDEHCLYWIKNMGQNNFSAPIKIQGTEIVPWELFATDLTGDTVPDILTSALSHDQIAWYENLNNVGIEKITRKEVKVSPNPVSNLLNIYSPEIIHSAEIMDMSGRIVKTRNNINVKTMEWDLSGMENGIYLIRINSDNEVFSAKVQKI